MGEELLSETLRCKHMIQIDTGLVTQTRVLLPLDWLDLDFVRIVDGKPLRFRSRDEFYDNVQADPNYNVGRYTITGNFLIVGGPIDAIEGKNVELSYYQTIPPLGDQINWLMKYYSRLYVSATMSVASAYTEGGEQQAMMWQKAVDEFVNAINDTHQKSKSSGSKLNLPRRKGFG
jgi:hypothetical protein